MARIAGVDLPREKRLEIALTYIFGIGQTRAFQVCDNLEIDRGTKVRDLTDDEVVRIRRFLARTRKGRRMAIAGKKKVTK
jgi:small subunit ribosomal protein S13